MSSNATRLPGAEPDGPEFQQEAPAANRGFRLGKVAFVSGKVTFVSRKVREPPISSSSQARQSRVCEVRPRTFSSTVVVEPVGNFARKPEDCYEKACTCRLDRGVCRIGRLCRSDCRSQGHHEGA